ncbi:restriction endonuclease subunit S [Pseudomonas sp. FYR_2]|uniref:restriction endonuclease subunit S n=1 Tax=unclassified Pseudomonas TaxID=196821 RepID=UPI00370C4C4F
MIWPVIKFSEAISRSGLFSDGDWVESKDQDPEGDVRLIQLADIGVGEFVNKSNRFMTSKRADELKCSYLQAGDILVARMPDPIGRACIFPEDMGRCVTVVDICIVRPDSERVDNRWLMHLINSERFRNQIDRHVTGTTRQRISRGNLAGLEIPLPPLPEQKRIAAILDKADAIRRKRHQAIQLADDFLRTVFLDMFGDPVTNPKGWEVKPLGQISTFENGDRSSAYPSGDDLVSEGVLFLSTKNIVSDTLRLESCQYITEDKYTALSRGKARKGDLIITLRGTLGSCCVFDCEHEKAFINAQMMIIRPGAGIGNIFLHDLLVSKAIKNHLQGIGQGAAVPQLTAKQLKELMLPIPPIQEQKRYENIRGSVLASIKKMQSESEESLFKAITQKAFTGQL